MKTFFVEVFSHMFGKISVPLSVIIVLWLLLSPSFSNIIQLQSKVEAHERRFDKIDILDEKLTAIMLELGIQKYRIERIENGKKATEANK